VDTPNWVEVLTALNIITAVDIITALNIITTRAGLMVVVAPMHMVAAEGTAVGVRVQLVSTWVTNWSSARVHCWLGRGDPNQEKVCDVPRSQPDMGEGGHRSSWPFTRFLYSSYAGQTNLQARVKVTARLRVVIRLFRVLFMMASREGVTFSRSMESLLRQAPRIIAQVRGVTHWHWADLVLSPMGW
jgi:hypothetical protein